PERSLFADIAAGSWGRIARLMAAGLCAGALWESFNAAARAKWIYTVPFLEHMKIFEMPPIGFLGFTFFALEVWSLYHLLAPRTRPRASARAGGSGHAMPPRSSRAASRPWKLWLRRTPTPCGESRTTARGRRRPRCGCGSGRHNERPADR